MDSNPPSCLVYKTPSCIRCTSTFGPFFWNQGLIKTVKIHIQVKDAPLLLMSDFGGKKVCLFHETVRYHTRHFKRRAIDPRRDPSGALVADRRRFVSTFCTTPHLCEVEMLSYQTSRALAYETVMVVPLEPDSCVAIVSTVVTPNVMRAGTAS